MDMIAVIAEPDSQLAPKRRIKRFRHDRAYSTHYGSCFSMLKVIELKSGSCNKSLNDLSVE